MCIKIQQLNKDLSKQETKVTTSRINSEIDDEKMNFPQNSTILKKI
jgi:hypothetical protein